MNLKYSNEDLETLCSRYETMYELHARVHKNLIKEIGPGNSRNVLEVACGVALNHDSFVGSNFNYFGLDISETAIAVALLKYPESRFVNIGVEDLNRFAEGSFDVVYNSSMLEHIGFCEEALRVMCHVAKEAVYVVFFEGLIHDGESEIKFHEWEESYISKEEYVQSFGVKNADQDHKITESKGWYWNRYSVPDITKMLERIGIESWEILDNSNRDWCEKESILVMRPKK